MPKLGFTFDAQRVEIESLLAEGRVEEGRKFMLHLLRRGAASEWTQKYAADVIEGKMPRGRPKSKVEPYWREIGAEVESLHAGGSTLKDAYAKVAAENGMNVDTVRAKVRAYRRILREAECEV